MNALSLQQQIIATIFGIVMFMALLFILIFPSRHESQLRKSFQSATGALAETVALGVEISLESSDYSLVKKSLDFARLNDDLIFVAVIDTSGDIWASYPENFVPDSTLMKSTDMDLAEASIQTEILVGQAMIGRSVASIKKEISNVRRISWLATLIALTLGGLGAMVLARRVAKPVERIVQAAEKVGKGDMDQRVDTNSSTELSRLGKAFNRMVEDLEKYMEAEAASKSKSAFLATMSHEIRTPLNGIIGMTSIVMETELTEEQADYVDVIRASGENLLYLVNDILDFSKADAGQMEIAEEPVNVRECISDVLRTFAPEAYKKGIELGTKVSTSLPELVLLDPLRIRQVLTNLVSNAVKFTHQGEVIVNIECTEDEAVESRIFFFVQDTGIGIPLEKHKTIFNHFTQVDSATTRKYGGTGLGLAISAKLVELMGGAIGVVSEIGSGSMFQFFIPLKAASDTEFTHRIQKHADKTAVLAIQNEQIEVLITSYLQDIGFQVHPLPPAGVSTTLQKQTAIDIAIVDARYIDKLKEAPKTKFNQWMENATFPIILLDVFGSSLHKKKDSLFSGLVYKPVDRHKLYDVMYDRLEEHNKTAQPARSSEESKRVLIVDNERIHRMLVEKMFANEGWHVTSVDYSDELWEKQQEGNYDVVLLDTYSLGDDLIPTLEQFEQEDSTPVVYLMNSTDEGFEEIVAKKLKKPLKKAAVDEIIEETAMLVKQDAPI